MNKPPLAKEIIDFLEKEKGLSLSDNQELIEDGGINQTYLFEKRIPNSDNTPSKHVVKIPRDRAAIRQVRFAYDNLEGRTNDELNKSGNVKQNQIRNRYVPFSEEIIYSQDDGSKITLSMEDYVPGITLEKLVKKAEFRNLTSKKREEVIVRLFHSYAKILSDFEAERILHNDLKPNNLKADFDNGFSRLEGYILDMNLSKDFESKDKATGSDLFIAPERLTNPDGTASARYDIFSLALSIYYLINEKTHIDLTDKNKARDMSKQILSDKKRFYNAITFDGMSGSFKKVMKKALAWNPEERYSSFEALSTDLKKLLPETRKRKMRNWLAGIGTAAILGISAFTYSLTEYNAAQTKKSEEFFERLKPLIQASVDPKQAYSSRRLTDYEEGRVYELINEGINEIEESEIKLGTNNDNRGNHIFSMFKANEKEVIEFRLDFGSCFIKKIEYNISRKFIKSADEIMGVTPSEHKYELETCVGLVSFNADIDMNNETLLIKDLQTYEPHDLSKVIRIKESEIQKQGKINLDIYTLKQEFKEYSDFSYIVTDVNTNDSSKQKKHEEYLSRLGKAPSTNQLTAFEYIKKIFGKAQIDEMRANDVSPIYRLIPLKIDTLPKDYSIRWTQVIDKDTRKEEVTTIPEFEYLNGDYAVKVELLRKGETVYNRHYIIQNNKAKPDALLNETIQ